MVFIAEYWLEVLFGIVVSIMGYGMRQIVTRVQKETDRSHAIELGVQALLRDRIVQGYYHYEERGTITLHGLEAIDRMYVEYHNLGGNGTITKLYNDLKELPVTDK